jgi:hypothetical protein
MSGSEHFSILHSFLSIISVQFRRGKPVSAEHSATGMAGTSQRCNESLP